MRLTRRYFIHHSAAALAAAALCPPVVRAATQAKIKVGSCSLRLEKAKAAGLDGVQVWAGGEADELDIFKTATRNTYKAQMQDTGLPVCSFMMGLLNLETAAQQPRREAECL